jgi:hypothetical protein
MRRCVWKSPYPLGTMPRRTFWRGRRNQHPSAGALPRVVAGALQKRPTKFQDRFRAFAVADANSRRLWRETIGDCVVMESDVIAQTSPASVLFRRLRHTVFLTRGKILPRIVTSDGEKRPGTAFQMLQQYVARAGVGWLRRFTEHLLQSLAMTGSGTINRNNISRAPSFGCGIGVDTHGAGEFLPGWPVHKRIVMPLTQVAFVRGHGSAGSFHGRF